MPTVDRRPIDVRPKMVVGLSGPMAAGKTMAARFLERSGFRYCRFSEILEEDLRGSGRAVNRSTLQSLGEEAFNSRFGQRRLQNKLAKRVEGAEKIVVDGLRHPEDWAFLRERWGFAAVHVHIRADADLRGKRYADRSGGSSSFVPSGVRACGGTECAGLGTIGRLHHRKHRWGRGTGERVEWSGREVVGVPVTVVVGGQFGSEGKGKVAHWLAREQQAAYAIRVGGPNSGHTAVENGSLVVLRHLPTPVLSGDVVGVIPAGAYVSIDVLLREVEEVGLCKDELLIDPAAVVIDDSMRAEEREAGLVEAIASTGEGRRQCLGQTHDAQFIGHLCGRCARASRFRSLRLAPHPR